MADTLAQEILEAKKSILAEHKVRLAEAEAKKQKFLIKTYTSLIARLESELAIYEK